MAGCLAGLSLLVSASSCPVQPGVNPIQALLGGVTEARGYTGVVFLNRSAYLVQPVVALSYPHSAPVVWVNSIAPDSWDSLMTDCGLTQLTFVGAVPTDVATGKTYDQVAYSGQPFVVGQDIVCGSVVVVEIADVTDPNSSLPITVTARTIPDSLSGIRTNLKTSPTAPGFNSGLIMVRPEQVSGVPMEVTASWETPDRFVYVLNWTLAGQGAGFGSLLECPVTRVGWGNLADLTLPAATLQDQNIKLGPPPPLEGEAFHCGDLVILKATGSADDPAGIQLTLTADQSGAEVQSGEIDLFGNIRRLIDETGFKGKLSNALGTLPQTK